MLLYATCVVLCIVLIVGGGKIRNRVSMLIALLLLLLSVPVVTLNFPIIGCFLLWEYGIQMGTDKNK